MDNTSALSLARVAVGAAAWLAPESRLWSATLGTAPQSPYLVRLFGAREIALGAMTLMADPTTRPTLLKVGVAVDAGDAVASVLATRSGSLGAVRGVLLTAMAAAGVGTGVAGLQQR